MKSDILNLLLLLKQLSKPIILGLLISDLLTLLVAVHLQEIALYIVAGFECMCVCVCVLSLIHI